MSTTTTQAGHKPRPPAGHPGRPHRRGVPRRPHEHLLVRPARTPQPRLPRPVQARPRQPPAAEEGVRLRHVAHKLVLGEGSQVEIVDYPDWKKLDARKQRDAAYAEGLIPILTKDYETAEAMAEAIRRHPIAGPLFAPGSGRPELSIFWTDPATGVRCRVRPDWLKELPGLALAVDYKTCRDANPDAISRAIRDHSYHQQDALYTDGIWAALDPADVRFVFVFQSKTAPYLITVRELAHQDREIGRARNERALRLYADCERTGIWPDWTGPVDEIPTISMPSYDTLRQAEEYLG
ncbi:PD-(D/E)XK nuclease-like domain-containing protein [Streptomyces sp. MS1.AVA.1]|uniref:PD-(D/E)XK nuclease-like domain-containing protein n=1 Tax=Streptomyces machairae TaxID=3134109 RepID=A0ABU8UU82_9ACTN